MHVGLGPIGALVARQIASRRGFRIVGAVDLDPQKVDRDLGDIIDAGRPLRVRITSDIDRTIKAGRPDVAVLCYPVITFGPPSAHLGSRKNLLGDDPPQELIDQMSAEKRVTARTPPTFIFHTADDAGVPVENALMYSAALRANKVPFELHVYEHGRHGVGLAKDDPILSTWTQRCAAWLATKKFGRGA